MEPDSACGAAVTRTGGIVIVSRTGRMPSAVEMTGPLYVIVLPSAWTSMISARAGALIAAATAAQAIPIAPARSAEWNIETGNPASPAF
jgi:hypothetical protein